MVTSYSYDTSLNRAKVYRFFVGKIVEKNEKEAVDCLLKKFCFPRLPSADNTVTKHELTFKIPA